MKKICLVAGTIILGFLAGCGPVQTTTTELKPTTTQSTTQRSTESTTLEPTSTQDSSST